MQGQNVTGKLAKRQNAGADTKGLDVERSEHLKYDRPSTLAKSDPTIRWSSRPILVGLRATLLLGPLGKDCRRLGQNRLLTE